ncbi:23S rRNA methyltransferase [Philodulcilactobacillus myokoensis]|uniref:23S rRNA methyltransferase n=1 Tax=Philodulcilactobacillus myokoensis TaxID=2929573 RepID=A0A9W6ESA2_9LACO|nr:RsmB/NOP family class I SAM-dependent RNA methyltransferase [Philodulcilactobacillus myokoensis]GLB46836.1 23S rRNA methyltransferase [Philodulcilactobacillus myokoensis]
MILPKEFINKYTKLLGKKSQAFFDSFNQPSYHGFRINPLKAHQPVEESLNHPIQYTHQLGYFGKVNGKTIDHQSGAVYSQEPSAMYVGEVANPKPGEKVLDLCAAPGGKTTHLASFMKNKGLLVTNEIIKKRAKILLENVERFGIQNAMILNETPDRLAKYFPRYFDKILVDAPCSGEGMFRKNPNATKYWNPNYSAECAKRQREILIQAVKMLRPGGELIYSTCTFAPEEDEQIIAWLLDQFSFELEPIHKYHGMVDAKPEWANQNSQIKNAVRLFPYLIKGEGHFIAKLKLTTIGKSKKIKKPQQSNLNQDQLKRWRQFQKHHFNHFDPKHLITFGDELYAYYPKIPNLKGLKVVRPGLHLGTFKKHRFNPSYALALAIHPDQYNQCLNINNDQWKKYVHGDIFKINEDKPKGWYLLICKHQPIGFGKIVNHTVKNFFPKGLRFSI